MNIGLKLLKSLAVQRLQNNLRALAGGQFSDTDQEAMVTQNVEIKNLLYLLQTVPIGQPTIVSSANKSFAGGWLMAEEFKFDSKLDDVGEIIYDTIKPLTVTADDQNLMRVEANDVGMTENSYAAQALIDALYLHPGYKDHFAVGDKYPNNSREPYDNIKFKNFDCIFSLCLFFLECFRITTRILNIYGPYTNSQQGTNKINIWWKCIFGELKVHSTDALRDPTLIMISHP